MNKCTGLMGQIFGHNYIPVVTKSAAVFPDSIRNISGAVDTLEKFRTATFEGAVCSRCGDIKSHKG